MFETFSLDRQLITFDAEHVNKLGVSLFLAQNNDAYIREEGLYSSEQGRVDINPGRLG